MGIAVSDKAIPGALIIFDKAIENARAKIAAELSEQDVNLTSLTQPLLYEELFNLSKRCLVREIKQQDLLRLNFAEKSKFLGQIFDRYPQLAYQLKTRIDFWIKNTLDLSKRWNADYQDLQSRFKSEDLGLPIELIGQPGDSHQSGLKTLVFKLSCGRKVVYKPRKVQVENAFFVFAKELGFGHLRAPWYLLKEHYAWMEFIEHNRCSSAKQITRYFTECGELLSLFYLLECSDMHCENIVASGSQPVPVDLETLFQHQDDTTRDTYSLLGQMKLGLHTVLKSGLIDASSNKNQQYCHSPLTPKSPFDLQCLPHFDGSYQGVYENLQAVIDGFTKGYRLIMTHKELLSSKHASNPLNLFANSHARYVSRKSSIYARLVDSIQHPDLQGKDSLQPMLQSMLRLDCESRAHLRYLVDGEYSAIKQLDIPHFTHDVSDHALFKDGQMLESEYFGLSGLNMVRQKAAHMSEVDLLGQIQLIKRTLSNVNSDASNLRNNTSQSTHSILDLIDRLCMKLTKQFIPHLDHWVLPLNNIDPSGGEVVDLANSSLYSGFTGALLFLAEAEKHGYCTLDDQFLINTCRRLLQDASATAHWQRSNIGFSGLGGLLYCASRLITLWPEQSWLIDIQQKLITLITDMDEVPAEWDITSGRAGVVLALIAAGKSGGQVKQALYSQAQRLNDAFLDDNTGSWQTYKTQKLFGFAHGLAGIGHALFAASDYLKEESFSKTSHKLLSHESQGFDPAIGNWPDLRNTSTNEPHISAWCHGAIGIGISRLKLLKTNKQLAPDFFEADIKKAINNFDFSRLQNNNALCHGNFGNAELIIEGAASGFIKQEQFDDFRQKLVRRLEAMICPESSNHSSGMCDLDASLMMGWSGIGYQLMRLDNPEKVPSVLTMSMQ